jgi:hypothetical protein
MRGPAIGDRGRLTIVDVVFIAVSVAVLAALAPAVYTLLQQQAGELGTGSGYLFQMVVPGIVATLLVVTYATATGGMTR